MPADSDFIAHLLEMLEPIGGVTARRMFGGYGLFRDGLMFGLVADGEFFLKVDDGNRPDFAARDLPPFRYEGREGRVMVMSYCRCPEDALDSPLLMTPWARSAIAAAERNRKPAKAGKPRQPKRGG